MHGTNVYGLSSGENTGIEGNVGIDDDYNYFSPEYYESVNKWHEDYSKYELGASKGFLSAGFIIDQNSLPMTVYQQLNNSYCGPASMQMCIKTINGQLIPQTTLASQAGTGTGGITGTFVYRIAETMRRYKSSYRYLSINNVNMFNAVKLSINAQSPIIYHLMTSSLPGYNGNDYGHYVAGYGYYHRMDSSGNVSYAEEDEGETKAVDIMRLSYADPWGPVLGKHTVSYDVMHNAVRRNAGFFICG